MKHWILKRLRSIVYIILPLIGGGWVGVSCSESTEEEEEFANWKVRNEAFFTSLEDSLRQAPAQWLKIKSYSLDETTEGKATDYVYAKVIRSGEGTDSPMSTDSIRVSYKGRLIPSASYKEGYVFDSGSNYGAYDDDTNATTKFVMLASGSEALITGWITALLHMHRGDYWRIYIPSELGYGTSGSGSKVPGHSVLIFDLTLVDFSPAGEAMKPYN